MRKKIFLIASLICNAAFSMESTNANLSLSKDEEKKYNSSNAKFNMKSNEPTWFMIDIYHTDELLQDNLSTIHIDFNSITNIKSIITKSLAKLSQSRKEVNLNLYHVKLWLSGKTHTIRIFDSASIFDKDELKDHPNTLPCKKIFFDHKYKSLKTLLAEYKDKQKDIYFRLELTRKERM